MEELERIATAIPLDIHTCHAALACLARKTSGQGQQMYASPSHAEQLILKYMSVGQIQPSARAVVGDTRLAALRTRAT